MKIIGHGIDIVEISQIEKIIERSGERFEAQCLTIAERNEIEFFSKRIQYIGGRWAAKEAVMKALGTGWSNSISFLDIEIQRLPTGQPSVILYKKCKTLAENIGITNWLISISHTESYVVASAIAVGYQSE
jgi:holo-[acyl-carrier protein] synthase